MGNLRSIDVIKLDEDSELDDEEFDEECRKGVCGHMHGFKDLSDVIFDKKYFKNLKNADKKTNKTIKKFNECKKDVLELKEFTACSVCHVKIDTVVKALDLSIDIITDIRDNLPEREAMRAVMKASNVK